MPCVQLRARDCSGPAFQVSYLAYMLATVVGSTDMNKQLKVYRRL